MDMWLGQENHGFFRSPEKQTACGIADQVNMGEGSANDDAGQGVILQPQELDHVQILSGFHQEGEDQNIEGQWVQSLRYEHSAKAADQCCDEYISDIRPNKIIVYIQRDIDFGEK